MRLWSFVIVLGLAIGLGTLMVQDPGYALFSYGQWTIEMPIWFSLFIFLGTVGVTLVLIALTRNVFSTSDKLKVWWQHHQENTARLKTYKGFLALAEGRFQNAERYLIDSAPHSDVPLINYLSAAQAAEEADAPERRDRYLQLALEADANSDIAVRLTQAQLQFKNGELEQSMRNLERLHLEAPKHPKVLRLLCTLYEALEDWAALYVLLPECHKNKILPEERLIRLEQKVYPALLPLYANKGTSALMDFFKKAPRHIQTSPAIVKSYATLLMTHANMTEAEAILQTTLKRNVQPDLIRLYGLLAPASPKKALHFAESLLKTHPGEPELFLTLGRLSLKQQLWGKAREYLEKSLAIYPMPETYAELGALMDFLDLTEKRDEYYKKGLLLATQNPLVQQKSIDTILTG